MPRQTPQFRGPKPEMTTASEKTGDREQRSGQVLGWAYHHWQNIRLAMPIVIGALSVIGISTADIIAMGWIDSINLAAGSLGQRYYQPVYFFALGMTLPVGALVAQALGARDNRQIRRALRQGLVISVAVGILFAPLVVAGPTILVWLGQDPELSHMATDFLIWSAIGLPFNFIFFVLRQYTVAHQQPLPQVIAALLGLGFNIIGNYAFIRGVGPVPAMGLAGIALATSLTWLLVSIGLMIYIATSEPYKLSKPFQRPWVMDWQITRQIVTLGFPIGLTIVAESGMFIAIGLIIGLFGTAGLAASAIANQIAAVAFMVPIALGQAGTIRVAHYAGRQDRQNLGRSAHSVMLVGILVTSITMVILLIWPEALVEIYLNQDDPLLDEVVALALPMVLIAAMFQIPDGLQGIANSVLRGLNDTRISALLAIGSFWFFGVGGGTLMGFTFGLGPVGVWAGLLVGLAASALTLTWRMQRGLDRIKAGGRILSG
jgi:MATE family multidrug resistance protein